MTASWRWLVGLGWGVPLVVAAAVAVAWEIPAGARPLARAGTVVLLTAPVLPLSLILFAVAAVAGRRTRRAAGRALGRADTALLRAATAGVVASLAGLAATIALYVT
jgi:hypothetical protein